MKWIKYFTLTLLLTFFYNDVLGSHGMGGEITYQCLGGTLYRFRATFYRDCSGVSAPSSVGLTIESASCGITKNITLSQVSGGTDITPLCPSASSTCSGGSTQGVEEYVYEGTVDLGAQCNDWKIHWSSCCRNGAIQSGAANDNFYFESTLNNLDASCNSSPYFLNSPTPYFCLGGPHVFNASGTDADGDSLVYQLVAPLNGPGSGVPYSGGYSPTDPLGPCGSSTFDPTT